MPDAGNRATVDALDAILTEYVDATSRFGAFASPHEGFAVLMEEVDELWDEVKAQSFPRMRAEAVQVAAMALRFLVDCCPDQSGATT